MGSGLLKDGLETPADGWMRLILDKWPRRGGGTWYGGTLSANNTFSPFGFWGRRYAFASGVMPRSANSAEIGSEHFRSCSLRVSDLR